MGTGFGSWLSRIPAVRDHLGATTFEMSLLGLSLALGSLSGLVFAGRSVSWLGPRRTLALGILIQAVAMPSATLLFWVGAPIPAAFCLAIFGFAFGTADVAMNVSGASAERALGKPRMPVYHAGFSLGSVSSMGIGALAEAAGIAVPIHLSLIFAALVAGVLVALRAMPHEAEPSRAASADSAGPADSERAGQDPADRAPADRDPAVEAGVLSTRTGPIPISALDASAPEPELAAEPGSAQGPDGHGGRAASRPYSPWRDPRILVIGLIAMSMSLSEGTASDWLPLALTDGRGFTNETAALTLGAFFVAMTLTRLAGSFLLTRFGRVPVLRGGALLVVLGITITILVPVDAASVVGAVLWGVGCAFGFPIGMSAAADDPETAVRGVAAVSAIAYTAFLLGPMLIGFLGDRFGLLQAFWPLVGFAAFVLVAAGAARETAKRGY